MVSISQLQQKSEPVSRDDLLLVSTPDKSAKDDGTTFYVSYSYKIGSLSNSLCDTVCDVTQKLVDNEINVLCAYVNKQDTANLNQLSAAISSHITANNEEFAEIKNSTTSIELSVSDLSSYAEKLSSSISILNENVSTNESNMYTSVNNVKGLLSNAIDELRSELHDWVAKNFVNLTGTQTITGKKTFTKDIEGIAQRARWA